MNVKAVTRIADINDEFRKTSMNFVLTRGVMALGDTDAVVDLVRRFDSFSESNDPYGEHDFGAFNLNGQDIFWKIDYYDQAFKYRKDPLNPECNRVLTVMLTSEY